ncbi:MAG: 4Fe-4S dicluster domain-containing protein [Clostridia bacterium]|jgi:ferredoxin like protein|nr:4Fe-4S dicluster domain-containing protein [Clostridia bacterium]MDH7573033.1 4Fe-4S dicluster domain-containing protein [Clostridia bacterium]
MADYKQNDAGILCGPQIVGAKVRELLQGKYEVIPKTKEHIKVDRNKCIGIGCQICYIICPTGSYEMEEGKAVWKHGMALCGECGACRYVCPVDAIDWSYPEAGTGIVLKYS